MTETTPNVGNYIVLVHGHGIVHTCLAKGTLDGIAEACQSITRRSNDLEVHIYSLRPSTRGRADYIPQGFTVLEEEWRLWDATDDFDDAMNDVFSKLDEHTLVGARGYLEHIQELVVDQLHKLEPEPAMVEPTFDSGESKTTGS